MIQLEFVKIENSDVKFQLKRRDTGEVLKEYFNKDLPIHFSREESQMIQKLLPKELEKVAQEKAVVEQQLFDTQTELLQTQLEKDMLGEELFNLQTELISKGVL